MKSTGNIFYKDGYDQIYEVSWETIGESIDITTITKQPYVWGQKREGYVKNKTLFRKGIITVHRQVLKTTANGYMIVAEGTSQYIDYFQATFPCEIGPVDAFKYHLDCMTSDEEEIVIDDGPRWADPSIVNDDYVLWREINPDGSVVGESSTAVTAGTEAIEWLDVWS